MVAMEWYTATNGKGVKWNYTCEIVETSVANWEYFVSVLESKYYWC